MESSAREWLKTSGNRKPLGSYFLGGIPPECNQSEVEAAISKRVSNIAGWTLELKARGDKAHHSGFGFVHCYSHEAMAQFGSITSFKVRDKAMECKPGWTVEEHKAKTHQDRQRKVYVSCIKKKTKAEAIRDHFNQYGEVKEVVIGKDKLSGRKLGFCVVEFFSEEATLAALEAPEHVIQGKRIQCNRLLLKHELQRPFDKPGKPIQELQTHEDNMFPQKQHQTFSSKESTYDKKAPALTHQTSKGGDKTPLASQVYPQDAENHDEDEYYPNSFSQYSNWSQNHAKLSSGGTFGTPSQPTQSLPGPHWDSSGSTSNKRSVKGATTGTRLTARQPSGHESGSPLFSHSAPDWPRGFEEAVLDTPPQYGQHRGLAGQVHEGEPLPVPQHQSHLQHRHSAEYGVESTIWEKAGSPNMFTNEPTLPMAVSHWREQYQGWKPQEPWSVPSKARPLPSSVGQAASQAQQYLAQYTVNGRAGELPNPHATKQPSHLLAQYQAFGNYRASQGQTSETRPVQNAPASFGRHI